MPPDVASLARFPLLRELSAGQRVKVAATAREVSFPKRYRLFDEGQPANGCWLLRSGHIALDTAVPGRGSVIVQTLGPGDVLGWSWLVPPGRWHFGAIALEAVNAVELDTGRLRMMIEQDSALGYHITLALFEALLQRLQSTRARLLDLHRSPREQ